MSTMGMSARATPPIFSPRQSAHLAEKRSKRWSGLQPGTPQSPPWTLMILALAGAMVVGLVVRQWAYDQTAPIRFELNQQNAFFWGDKIVHGDGPGRGNADWKAFWRSYLSVYDADVVHPLAEPHTLDYVPLRLLMAGLWVKYLNHAYGPVSQWRPEFARSFAAFSMVMELAGATAMFALVAAWLKRIEPNENEADVLPSRWLRRGRWEAATAAAILLWLNPAAIVDSHVWPHGQTWILPFYLASILAMIENRFFLAGIIFGLGSMFKGQMMLVAPVLILWPLFDRRLLAAVWVALGMACGVGMVVWPWLCRGSMAWARIGFAAHADFTDVLRKGDALNIPAVLERFGHMTLHQRLIDRVLSGVPIHVELRSVLMAIYAPLLVLCAWGIARQARMGSRHLLASIAAPWALMFFVLGQMDERYLVWSACFTAGAVAVGEWEMAAHLMFTWAGAATMLEFLMNSKPGLWPLATRVLIMTNPITWLLIAFAVAVLFYGSIRSASGNDPLVNPSTR
jgi:hypothetical protein